ncbi:MAG: hypothetical protein R3B90_18335 [Planctomycetaceae bacterium]
MKTTTFNPPPSTISPNRMMHCLRLTPVRAAEDQAPWVFGAGEVLIGSATGCDLVLAFGGVGAEHCVIEFDGQQAIAAAKHPMSWLNDGPFRRSRVRGGDVLALGPVELKVDFVDVPAPPEPPSAPVVEEEEESIEQLIAEQLQEVPAASLPSKPVEAKADVPEAGVPSSSIDALIAEAEAARCLREDLNRLEAEVARLRTQSTVVELPMPKPAFAGHGLPLSRTLRSQFTALPVDPEADEDRHSVGEPRVSRSTLHRLMEQVRLQRAQLQRESRRLEQRESELAQSREEFDAAVEALDEDRLAWREQCDADRRLLEEQLSQLADDREALNETASDLRRRAIELHEREQKLGTREAQLIAARTDLAEREEAFELRESQLRKMEEELASRSVATERERAEVAALQAELAAAREAIQQENSEHSHEQAWLEAQYSELRREQEELRHQSGVLETERGRLASEAQALEQRELALASSHEELQRREQSLSVEEQRLADRTSELEAVEAALDHRVSELESQAADLDDRAADLAARSQSLQADAEQLELSQSELTAQQRQLDGTAAELEARRLELEAAQEADVAAFAAVSHGALSSEEAESLDLARQEIEQERARLQELRERLDQRTAEIEERDRSLDSDRRDHAAALVMLAESRSELDAERAKLELRQRELADAAIDAEVEQATAREQALQAELSELRAEAEAELERLEQELAAAIEERETFRNELTTRSENDRESADQLSAAQLAELHHLQAELEAERRTIEAERERLDEAWEQLRLAATHRIEDNSEAESVADLAAEAPQESNDAIEDEGPTVERPVAASRMDLYQTAAPATGFGVLDFDEEAVEDDDTHSDPVANLSSALTASLAAYGRTAQEAESEVENRFGVSEYARTAALDEDLDDAHGHGAEESDDDSGAAPVSSGTSRVESSASPIRSQLAALFGISADSLEETARRHPELAEAETSPESFNRNEQAADAERYELETDDESEVDADEYRDEPAFERAGHVEPADSIDAAGTTTSDEDSVANYMQKLLGRYQTAEPAAMRHPEAEELAGATSAPAGAEPEDVSGEVTTIPKSRNRPKDGDKERIKADLNAMRQVANMSARSAVATHHTRQLGSTFQMKMIVTALAAVVTVALLTAQWWGNRSYLWQGLASCVFTGAAAWQLISTKLSIRQIQRRAMMAGLALEDDAETTDEVSSQAEPPQQQP